MQKFMTVPEYYAKYIDSKVNLAEVRKVCCPFHEEKTPSFSYDAVNDRWRCFGACHTGGDVVDLHKFNYHLRTREEALESLCHLEHKPYRKGATKEDYVAALKEVNTDSIEFEVLYNKLLIHATTPERWLQLDYAMQVYPSDIYRLKDLEKEWNL